MTNSKPKLPPPHQRLIEVPGMVPPADVARNLPQRPPQPHPAMLPSSPILGPDGQVANKPKPVTAAITFIPPPGMEDAAPVGVFWPTPDGGILVSQAIRPPMRMAMKEVPQQDGPPTGPVPVEEPKDEGNGEG